jgi:signal transduction histidine kinase
MIRLGLRARLLIAMFAVISVSIALISGQAVLLFQEDKSSYVFDLNASRALTVAGDVQANVRHLIEKMRIFADAVRLAAPEGVDRRDLLTSMLRQYPEFLLFSVRGEDGQLRNIFLSRALGGAGLTVDEVHAAYLKGAVPFDSLTPDRPFLARLGLSAKLPTFTLGVRAFPGADGKPGPALVAEFPIDRLYAMRGESRLFEIHVTDSKGHPLIAPASAPIRDPAEEGDAATPAFAGLLPKTAATAGTREYVVGGVPMLAAYAPSGNLGLWSVVQIPKARAFEAASRLVTRSLVIAAIVGLAALGLVVLLAASITKPLLGLIHATGQIGQGQFNIDLPATGGGEIGELGARFRRMGEELAAREGALQDANRRVVESEKMSAIGQLGAGIAHEVKNPLTSIRGYAQMGLRKAPADSPLREYFLTIERETGRSLEILKNLLRFSRQETAEMSPIELNAVVQDTVKLVSHQLGMKNIQVAASLSEDPLNVLGNANQLEQVLLNLMMNAGDAMESGGTVTVATRLVQGSKAMIQVSDTGGGIPPEVVSRVFDPFFTTKPVGKGTGLGLSVSYGIVKEHKGDITVRSKVGEGTTFTIVIPAVAPAAVAAPAAPAAPEKKVRVISLR